MRSRVTCFAGGSGGQIGAEPTATEAGFPCTALPDALLDSIGDDVEKGGFTGPVGRNAVGLLDGSEHFVACTVVADFLYAGVLGFDQQAPLSFHLEPSGRKARSSRLCSTPTPSSPPSTSRTPAQLRRTRT